MNVIRCFNNSFFISENWSKRFQEEFHNLQHDSQLKGLLLSLIKQKCPFSWIKNRKALKKILSREITKEFAEEIFSEHYDKMKYPLVKLTLDDKKSGNFTKETKYEIQAQLGHSTDNFNNG